MATDSKSGLGSIMRDLGSALGELFTGGKLENNLHMPVEVAFSLFGYLAKADSIITSHEAEFVNGLMEEFKLPTQGLAMARAAFDRGRTRQIDVKAEAQRWLDVFPKGSVELNRLFDTLLKLAAADGRVFPRERKVLEEITAALGFSQETLNARLESIAGID